MVAMALTGCASNQKDELRNMVMTQQEYSVGWINQEWRVCREDCPKPTAKTIEMVVVQSATTNKVKPAPAPAPVRGPVVMHFESAKSTPVGGWERPLEEVKRQVEPSDKLLIKSYTDDVGGADYNNRLAKRRAEAVVKVIKNSGITNPVEIEVRSKCCYVAPNTTKEGRAQNRRVEIYFINKGESM